MASFYCVKCRAKKEVSDSDVQRITMKNGKPAMKSKCPDCSTTMFKIGK
ncbi:MAG TPA: DUF5679 domain-containing protein [Candidatus Bathyarchaeia archaeon]|nr:DUF5679 domain-containing protein [Candidatus Bathyarchaeia archaeon]